MQIKELQKLECEDGLCLIGGESVQEITLSPLEKRAIFFSIKKVIDKAKEECGE